MRNGALWLTLSLSLAARAQVPGFVVPQVANAPTGALKVALDGVDAGRIKGHVAFLADPKQEGRGLGTEGLKRVEQYLLREMKAAGLQPVPGQKSLVQAVPLRRISHLGGNLTLPGHAPLRDGLDCVLPYRAPEVFVGELVDVGLGIQEPTLGHDDYRGLDLRGKIAVLHSDVPAGAQWQKPEFLERWASPKVGDRYDARVDLLERLGAKAVVAIEPDMGPPEARETIFRPEAGVTTSEEPPLVRVKSLPPFEKGTMAKLEITGQVEVTTLSNLIGCIPGTDPVLSREAVVIGAHMDHLGMSGGQLHPGADDNASGVSALLEILRAFAKSSERPRCTVLFAFWTGEEDGKFGSGHYVRHPLWALERTKAYLNLDMVGHPWTAPELRKLVEATAPTQAAALLGQILPEAFAEPGFADWVPELGEVLAQAGQVSGMALHLDPTDGRSGGSDYRDFARQRVPFVRFFGNFFPEYHQPGDTAERLDANQVKRMARLALATAWGLSMGPRSQKN